MFSIFRRNRPDLPKPGEIWQFHDDGLGGGCRARILGIDSGRVYYDMVWPDSNHGLEPPFKVARNRHKELSIFLHIYRRSDP